MKKVFKVLAYLLGAVIILVGIGIGYIKLFLPNVEKAPEIKVQISPERIENGKYLATSVAVCIDCHSTRDWTKFSGPIVNGTEGKGGEIFSREMGFPGKFYSKNISPAHLENWTDGEIFRAITVGVSKDGSPLFPVMPYQRFGEMDREDIYDIIAYIRSLPSQQNDVPESKPDFPLNIILHTIPKEARFSTKPPQTDTVAYGKYLVTMASCIECHTQENKGELIKGMEFAGGRKFVLPGGVLRSANITPSEQGIGGWSEAQFIGRFKEYEAGKYTPASVTETDFNTVMPWSMYAGMKESDLAAIYKYLRTLKPHDEQVNKFTASK